MDTGHARFAPDTGRQPVGLGGLDPDQEVGVHDPVYIYLARQETAMKDVIEVMVGLCFTLLLVAVLAWAAGEWVVRILFD